MRFPEFLQSAWSKLRGKSIGYWLRAIGIAVVCAWGTLELIDVLEPSYPVEDWLVWSLLPVWAYTLLFNAVCVAGGSAVVDWLVGGDKLHPLEWLVQSMAVGLVIFVLGMYVAGWFCLFNYRLSLGLPVLMALAGIDSVPRLWRALSAWRNTMPTRSLLQRAPTAVALGLGAALIVFLYLEALHFSNINFDAKWYHIPTAQDYARTGCIIPLPGDDHRTFPHLTSIVQTWALLVPKLEPVSTRWMLILHLELGIVVWRIVGLAAAVCWLVNKRHTSGIWVAFFLFPSIFIYDQNIGGSADHYLGFFAIPIMLAAARTLRRFEWEEGVLLGLLLGGHILTKYQAAFLFSAVTLLGLGRWAYLAIRRIPRLQRPGDPSMRSLGLGLGVIVLVTAGVSWLHFGKNALFYKNPVYPFGQSYFASSFPKPPPGFYEVVEPPEPEDKKKEEAEEEEEEEEEEDDGKPKKRVRRPLNPRGEGWERVKNAAELVYTYSFTTGNRHHTKGRPYMGALFSLLLPCLLFLARSRRVWYGAAMGALALFSWAYLAPNDRYLLSFLDILIAATAAIMVRVWDHGWVARAALVPLVALQALWGGDAMIIYGNKRLDAARSFIWSGYQGNDLETRLAFNQKNQDVTEATPKKAVILARNYKNLLGLDRLVVSDHINAGGYVSYSNLRSPHEAYNHFRSRGITHLLYPEGKRKPRKWNNVVLFAELFHHYGLNKRQFSNLHLATLPSEPPAPAPYMVFTRYLRIYHDGLYRVEQLDAHGRSSKRFKPRPFPMRRRNKKNGAALLAQARAAIICKGLNEHELAALRKLFHQVEKFRRCGVYLRRGR